MKSSKMNGLQKFVSFVLIAILLVFIVGFAASGLDEGVLPPPDDGTVNEPPDDSGNNGDNTNKEPDNINDSNNNGSNEDNNNNQDSNSQPQGPDKDDEPNDEPDDTPDVIIPPEPKYYSVITGLEITKDALGAIPYGYVLDPSCPLYGVSSSDVSVEFPMEDGTTRMLSYTTDSSLLWKIGSLVETRNYITGMSKFFGGVVVSYGCDDIVNYEAFETDKLLLDLSKKHGCYFLENTLYIYTSKEMTDDALSSSTNLNPTPYKSSPVIFSEEPTLGIANAYSVTIPYSEKSKVELLYSEKTGRYLYYKAGMRKMDMLSGNNVGFDNAYILFADATTYEKSHGSELVMDTVSGGTGYYITKGTYFEIRWGINEIGELTFYSLSGEKLIANTGTSYIAYYKSSQASGIKIN